MGITPTGRRAETHGCTVGEIRNGRVVLIYGSSMLYARRVAIAELAMKSRLPTMCSASEWIDAGFVMSYGTSLNDMYRRAPYFVDKILKGAKPADLPVEQPTKFELVINLKTAKALGLTISPSLLARADQVIDP
jgi:putative ABC transport system substrate-binding protein